jgi:hypothetical protein
VTAKLKREPTQPESGSDLLGDLLGAGSFAFRRREEGGSECLCIRLAPNPTAPQRARRAVETLGDRLDSRAIADLRVVVTELVTICLSSSDEAPIEVRVKMENGHVRGEVGQPEGSSVDVNGPGHALRIVGALVEEWGMDSDRAMAWFRMSASD